MEILKPIFCATALMGMHIASPILWSVFQKLYKDMVTLQPPHFLQNSECVVSFVSTKVFKQASPKVVIINSLNECLKEYKTEVENILRLFLRAFSHGLAVQKELHLALDQMLILIPDHF